MPAISVIVPVYKVEQYLKRCINSILTQTFVDFELILVDDGSPDNCGTICDEYVVKDSRVVVIHQENGGVSVARNIGVEWAKIHSDSQWISFIDSDDWIHPCFLEKLYQAAQIKNVKVSGCKFQRVYKGASPVAVHESVVELRKTEDVCCSGRGIEAYPVNYLYHKDLFDDIKFPPGRRYEDVFTIPKLLFQVPYVAYVEQELYYYFYHENSFAHSGWTSRQLDIIYAYEDNLRYFAEHKSVKLKKSLAHGYLVAIHSQAVKVQNSGLKSSEKKYYSQWLRWKMWAALFRYARQADIHIGKDGWLFAVAYPRLMELYWFVCGQLNKLKK